MNKYKYTSAWPGGCSTHNEYRNEQFVRPHPLITLDPLPTDTLTGRCRDLSWLKDLVSSFFLLYIIHGPRQHFFWDRCMCTE